MSDENKLSTPPASVRDSAGVLANLPRTRPQRSSARRLAARDGAAGNAARETPARPRAGATGAPTEARTDTKAAKGTRKQKPAAQAGAPAEARPRTGAASSKRARSDDARSRAGAAAKKAPRQGFESEADATSGPVVPPGATEFLGAATELLTDVAKSGLERGASTLRELLGRLHLS